MNELFEKIYAASNIETEESKQLELFERIYNESEMLNEMNPKLKALLAAGALAAGLGMQSCSMPTDIPYGPPVIEQPAPTDETPTDETPGEETPETPGETTVSSPIEQLTTLCGAEHANRLISAESFEQDNELSDFFLENYDEAYTWTGNSFEQMTSNEYLEGYFCETLNANRTFVYHIADEYTDLITLINAARAGNN